MPLSDDQLREIVHTLVSRPKHENVRTRVRDILVHHLDVPSAHLKLEENTAEVRGKMDALFARTVFEFKSDLRNERQDAEAQLTTYLHDRETATGLHFVGVATDGAGYLAYELRRGELKQFKSTFNLETTLRSNKGNSLEAGRALAQWLGQFLTAQPELHPEPDQIRAELGRQSALFESASSLLETMWEEVADYPEVKLKRQLWAERLKLVYGDSVDADTLFFQHTYLTIVAKTMATLALEIEPPAARELLAGRAFSDAGISGVVESDFFDWILDAKKGAELVGRISAHVARFRLGDIRHDVLKVLYESLIDPEQRHDLGEYYTPDWLAQRMCAHVIDRPLEQRILDPSCGSGTFLFHAVRRFLEAADAAGMSNAEALRRCTTQIFGIDVHPVAVINARVTYVLALGEKRLRALDRPQISIPVYLGDSMQWDTQQVLTGQTISIKTPEVRDEAGKVVAPSVELVFPYRVAENPEVFDRILSKMLELSEQSGDANSFISWLKREGDTVPYELHQTLVSTYEKIADLRQQKRNHIWGYVARNLSDRCGWRHPARRSIFLSAIRHGCRCGTCRMRCRLGLPRNPRGAGFGQAARSRPIRTCRAISSPKRSNFICGGTAPSRS